MSEKLSDTEALNQIHRIIDGVEWSADTVDEVAHVLSHTGRTTMEPGEHTREELIELVKEDWLNSIASAGSTAIDHILMEGHTGFSNMSYSELLRDAQNAGLLDEEG